MLGNAQVNGYPIVYCSDGFVDVSGYPRAQIMQKGGCSDWWSSTDQSNRLMCTFRLPFAIIHNCRMCLPVFVRCRDKRRAQDPDREESGRQNWTQIRSDLLQEEWYVYFIHKKRIHVGEIKIVPNRCDILLQIVAYWELGKGKFYPIITVTDNGGRLNNYTTLVRLIVSINFVMI